jgi:hypothetical protein
LRGAIDSAAPMALAMSCDVRKHSACFLASYQSFSLAV